MSDQEKANGGSGGARERLREEFASLPLDKKLASLFEFEMVTLSESVSYVVNNSGEIFNHVADAVSDFSQRVECEFKKRTESADTGKASAEGPAAEEKAKEKARGHKKPKSGEDE